MPELDPRRKKSRFNNGTRKKTVLSGHGGDNGSRFPTEFFKSPLWGFISTWGIVTIIFVQLVGAVFGRYYSFFEQYSWTLALTAVMTYFLRHLPPQLVAFPIIKQLSEIQIGGVIRTIWSALVLLFFVMFFVNLNRYGGARFEVLVVQTFIDMRMIIGAIFTEAGRLFQ